MSSLDNGREYNMLWFGQRYTCLACRNCATNPGTQGETIMRCRAGESSRGTPIPYCIDTRAPGERCGPDALLFQPKE